MTNPYVDELSMMTYLSKFPEATLKSGAPIDETQIIKSKPLSKDPEVYESSIEEKTEKKLIVDGQSIVNHESSIDQLNTARLDGKGLEQAFVGYDNVIDVYTDQAGPGDVTVEFTGPIGSSVKYSVVKVDNNHFQVHFSPESAGVYKANILINGFSIEENPREILTTDIIKVTKPEIQSDNRANMEDNNSYFDSLIPVVLVFSLILLVGGMDHSCKPL